MHIVPINEAEAIIDPFWDSALSEIALWTIESGNDHGLVVRQNWCWVEFEWARRPESGLALRMQRDCDISCAGYDHLVLSVMAPENSVVHIIAETDCGQRRLKAPPAGQKKKELALNLDGAGHINIITIEIEASADGISKGWFNWLGLQHCGRFNEKLKVSKTWDSQWEKHLKDESFTPQFLPTYGLLLNAGELDILRQKHDSLLKDGKISPFIIAANEGKKIQPELLINDFVNFWGDTRYVRERDHDKLILNHGLNLAIAGHLLKDKELLRLAARFALSIGMCKNWDDGFICRFPSSTFDHRCFVQSLCATEVAGILDLAGEFFTDLGREFLQRRLAEEAIGAINYNTWKYDYIFKCNQLAWFTPGRMLALGVLKNVSHRVQPYIDIAYNELCESLEHTILSDGGYMEGPTYFRCVGRDAGLGIYFYSRIMGKTMIDCIPASMKRCGDFAEALISTDNAHDVIPICDASSIHEIISQSIMASLLPGSAWSKMLSKTITRNNGWPVNIPTGSVHSIPILSDAAIAWGITEQLNNVQSEILSFVSLPEMGPLASIRKIGDHQVKLLIQGNKANAGHTHEDKGSFILEFAGDTFAIDPGTCDYSNPLAGVLHNCERHNMLVPYGFHERPAPDCPLPYDVKPVGSGDHTKFHAEIDVTPGWDKYYNHWHRIWDSPTPDVINITDYYELVSGEGVEFYWQTRLPVRINGSIAIITGQNGNVELEAKTGESWRIDELPLLDGIQNRLALRQSGRSGMLTVMVRLYV